MIAPIEKQKTCCVGDCGRPRVRYSGSESRCIKHARYYQMQYGAKQGGKTVPSTEKLEELVSATRGFSCKYCGVEMTWKIEQGRRGDVASLQHCRDGSMEIMCLRCNAREGAVKHEESFTSLPWQHVCSRCNVKKSKSEFDVNRNAAKGVASWCKECRRDHLRKNKDAINTRRREKNNEDREAYNLRARLYRKANPDVMEKLNAKRRADRKANPEKYKAQDRRKRAKKASLQGDTHLSGTFIEKQLAGV